MSFWLMAAFCLLPILCSVAEANDEAAVQADAAAVVDAFVEAATDAHGALGERAARFLVEGMPDADRRTLGRAFLLEHLRLALIAREEFPWARDLPEDVFFNDVLPYASLDETREPWRRELYEMCRELVRDCATTTEAAQVVNREVFRLIDVHYDTGRKAPNQSPSESKALGKASCTGLSIILVDACRSVGVPARVAGTALWVDKRGNHTWAEIWDGGQWFFTGADEYDKRGLNRAWFTGDAARAIPDNWQHAIWATSWKPTGSHFPMVWNMEEKSVPAVNVTARYAMSPAEMGHVATISLRVWGERGGERLALPVEILDASGTLLQTVTSKAGRADLNDMAAVVLRVGADYSLRVVHEGLQRGLELKAVPRGATTVELVWSELDPGHKGPDAPLPR